MAVSISITAVDRSLRSKKENIKLEIFRADKSHTDMLAPLVADFRVTLNELKGIKTKADIASGRDEISEFLDMGYPVFAAVIEGKTAGYLVLRQDDPYPCVWVEHIFVKSEFRRIGVGTALFEKAEETAKARGEDTMFNYVHPNNDAMIQFLRSKGYTVLNLIEIRKPYKGEKLTGMIKVADHSFDY